MNGKVCIVTGATSGIGKAAAAVLARMGAQVVLVGRDQGRAEAAVAEIGMTLARPFFLSPERGADTIVYLATSPDVAGQTGGYYVKRQRRDPSAAARDDAAARKLWDISEEMTGLPAQPMET